jgi:hypothetical protein
MFQSSWINANGLEILPADAKDNYSIVLTPADYQQEDELHLGYTRLEKL